MWVAWVGLVAGPTGLEPVTSGVTGRRSSRLNYDPANVCVSAPPGWGAGATEYCYHVVQQFARVSWRPCRKN